jgi:hypothetical protein
MLCWELTEKRRGDTTSPRNAAADFAVSRALEVVFRAHVVPTFCTAGACPRGNGQFESIQRAWAGGALRTVPATRQPTIWYPISRLLHFGGLFELLAGYQSRPIYVSRQQRRTIVPLGCWGCWNAWNQSLWRKTHACVHAAFVCAAFTLIA